LTYEEYHALVEEQTSRPTSVRRKSAPVEASSMRKLSESQRAVKEKLAEMVMMLQTAEKR
jgi:hypothetical protein